MIVLDPVRDRANDCTAVHIRLANPDDIRGWSYGEVKKAETINYRTRKPEKDGLFCERIFGPARDWQCGCGQYRGMRYREQVCPQCGVMVAHSRSRRYRMGHIDLAAPVVHVWFFRSTPSRLGTLLDLKKTALERIIYFQEHVVLDPADTSLEVGQTLTDRQLLEAHEAHGENFQVGMGAEAIRRLLERLDLGELAVQLRMELEVGDGPKPERRRRLLQRLKIVETLRDSSNRPEWMVLQRLPVIPPDLRPLVLLESGTYASSDLNDLYRRIINRNQRLRKLLDLRAPEIIIRNEKRMLQQAVDALFDNSHCKQPLVGASNRPLKSLTDMLLGKQGRFRENLLGKRVDYSARSVIVVGPELKLHQCGLPKVIALELFQPFIIRKLRECGLADTVRKARDLLRQRDARIWDVVEDVVRHHPVLLNRAPTLHRMGIQAFEPVLIEGNALRIHPLVCKAFNADFDGDQMAVPLPLSIEAQVEARVLLMSTNNVLSPANGQPIISPSQDIVLGCYYLTSAIGDRPSAVGPNWSFATPTEVFLAHALGKVGVHEVIQVRLPISKRVIGEKNGGNKELPRQPNGLVATTVGRVLFNDILHSGMAFYDLPMTCKHLSRIIADCGQELGCGETIALLDRMKDLGFRWATRSGLTFATDNLRTPPNKAEVLRQTDKEVERVNKQYQKGLLTAGERSARVVDLWNTARDRITDDLMTALARDARGGRSGLNPIHLMVQSGARSSAEQLRQLAGMRGLMARPSGEILETPVKASFREGLSVLEYFSSTHGARKGLADTALKTAEAGHLTRKLADVAQNVVVVGHDCGTTSRVTKCALVFDGQVLRSLADVVRGRVTSRTVKADDGKTLLRAGELISASVARRLEEAGVREVEVRSPLTCEAPHGVCRLCYGVDLSTGALAEEGLAVGIIAAQSIGEPGTQLTLRNFHIGGVHSAQDITRGLPRITELLEAYQPENPAILAEVSGQLRVGGDEEIHRRKRPLYIQPLGRLGHPIGNEHRQFVSVGKELRVPEGAVVEAGEALTAGTPSPHDLLRIRGLDALQRHLVDEVQSVYRHRRVEIDDRHVEVIVAQMLRRVKVESAGDSGLLPGAVIDRHVFRTLNERLSNGGAARRPATCSPVLLGISRAAVQSDSFISAASFQETTKVLTEAALAGKIDPLVGLKENVIIGRLIPAGTGYSMQCRTQRTE